MQKINQIFGKEVINQTSGEKIATVQDVVLDNDTRHIVALIIRAGGLMGSSSVVRWGSVVSVGDVVVVQGASELPSVKDDSEVSDLVKQSYRITGTSVISDKGEQLGTVGDIYIDERGAIVGYEVKHGMLKGNKYLPAEHVQAAGKDAVISRLAELPRMKDIDTGPSESGASGIADTDAVAAPHVSTLGAQNDADTASTYTGATTAIHSSDESITSSTQADAYSYTSSEPAAGYTNDDTAATAYSTDTQDAPAPIYADNTADEPDAATSTYSADTPDTDAEPAVVYTDDESTTYSIASDDETVLDEPDAATSGYSTDAADEPAMADPDAVDYHADEPDAATPAYGTDRVDEPVMADPDVVAHHSDTADKPVTFGADAEQDAVQAYTPNEPQEPAASADTGDDPYANKSNQM